jgi:hypothetical protein
MKYTPDERIQAQIDNAFTYHPPIADQAQRYIAIREAARGLAKILAGACPPSRELSLALTHLEDAVMWANASIARNEKE